MSKERDHTYGLPVPELLPCPCCGSAAKIYAENMVGCAGCEDQSNGCDLRMDFGHWCGVEKGVPAVVHVIRAWNRRPHTEPVPQDELGRVVMYTDDDGGPCGMAEASQAAEIVRDFRCRWCWWDEVDAMLGGGADE